MSAPPPSAAAPPALHLQQLRDEIVHLRLASAPQRAEVGAPRSAVHCTATLDVHIAQQLDALLVSSSQIRHDCREVKKSVMLLRLKYVEL